MSTPRLPMPTSRRGLIILTVLMVLLVAGFAVVAGVYLIARLGGVRADVVGIDKLPKDVFVCDHFQPSSGVITVTNGSQQRFEVSGDCPENLDSLSDTLTSELEYRGWTVHSDTAGNITAYNYSNHEALSATLGDSASQDNATTVSLLVFTSQKEPPPDFPAHS